MGCDATRVRGNQEAIELGKGSEKKKRKIRGEVNGMGQQGNRGEKCEQNGGKDTIPA